MKEKDQRMGGNRLLISNMDEYRMKERQRKII